MKAMMIANLVKLIIGMLTPELLKQFADTLLDWIEDNVKGSKSTVDDAIVLPFSSCKPCSCA